MNWHSQQKLREAYMEFGNQMGVTHAVTLATHKNWSMARMTKLIGQLSVRMNDIHLGSTWRQNPISSQINGIFYVEGGDPYGKQVHAHGLVCFPYGNEWGRKLLIEHFWRKLCPSGTTNVEKLWSNGFSGYASKEMRRRNYDVNRIVLVADFMSENTLTSLAEQR